MRITKLDGLRGLFSMMIVIYHYPPEFIPSFIHNSFIVANSHLFVDFFFVLSGFVITYNYNNLLNTKTELGIFVLKRFIRLYPLLLYTTLVFLFVTLGVKILLPEFAKNKDSFLPAILDTVSTLTFFNSTPVFDDNFGGNKYGMNYPSWSISAEMFAYLFFGGITLWAVQKRKSIILASSVLIGMIFLLVKILMKIEGNYDFVRAILSFNIGYFVYLYSKRDITINKGLEIGLTVFFFGLFYAAFVVKEQQLLKTIIEACVIPVFFGLSIFTLIQTDGVVSKLMETRLFQFLGKISYSVYLNHAILVYVFPKAMFSIFKVQQTAVTEILTLVIAVFLVIIYSYVTYNIIELKGGNILRRRVIAKPKS